MRTVRYNHLKNSRSEEGSGDWSQAGFGRQPKKEMSLMNEAMVEAINEREPAFLARDGKGRATSARSAAAAAAPGHGVHRDPGAPTH